MQKDHAGQDVDTWSEEFRHQCLVRHIIKLRLKDRDKAMKFLETWEKKGSFGQLIESIGCSFSRRYCKKTEKEMDILAVKKGYKEELRAQREKRFKIKDENYHKLKDIYLNEEEIDKL